MITLAIAIAMLFGFVPAVSLAGTTVITHGFEPISGMVPLWTYSMGRAVLRAAGDTSGCGTIPQQPPLGTIFVYDPDSGDWLFGCGSMDPGGEMVLVFDWSQESDGLNIGGTQGFTEAAADALYAALRDPVLPPSFSDVDLLQGPVHFIGHSRGSVVNSDCVERLGSAGIEVDQVTTLDPHPVNGTFNELVDADWGDRAPVTWTTVGFTDNYWRADGGGLSSLDFDGMSLATDVDLDLGPAIEYDFNGIDDDPITLEHTEVHAWYHGTTDLLASDDEVGNDIDNEIANWWGDDGIPARDMTGFFYSAIVGGARPGPVDGVEPTWSPLSFYNGDFELVNENVDPPGIGYAGWFYHGGDKPGAFVPWASSDPPPGSHYYMSLSSGSDTEGLTHNRVYVDDSVTGIEMLRRVAVRSDDDRFHIVFSDGVTDSIVVDAPLDTTTPWTPVSFPIPVDHTGRTYAIRFEIVGGAGPVESQLDLDAIRFVPEPGNGAAVVALGVLALLGRRTRKRNTARAGQWRESAESQTMQAGDS